MCIMLRLLAKKKVHLVYLKSKFKIAFRIYFSFVCSCFCLLDRFRFLQFVPKLRERERAEQKYIEIYRFVRVCVCVCTNGMLSSLQKQQHNTPSHYAEG